MIPQWRDVMRDAASHLSTRRRTAHRRLRRSLRHAGLVKVGLYRWLKEFHVTPRADLFDVAEAIAAEFGGTSERQALYRGFAWIAVLRKPAA